VAERRLEREKEHLKHYVSEDAWAAAHSATGTTRADEVEVAVLFSDICGFTPKCEKLTARQIVDLLNEYFDRLCPAVKNNHGSIDKFVGDCIMAVFHGHDGVSPAEDAVRAGLELQRVLHEEFNKGKPEPFENRVGINCGLVVQGDIGARDYRRDFTVIGDVVNIASRLEGAAEHGTTLVSDAVYERVKHLVDAVERPEPLKLKGKETKVHAYKITGLRAPGGGARPAPGAGASS
jgi:adenylate cyclase